MEAMKGNATTANCWCCENWVGRNIVSTDTFTLLTRNE